jgi:uncharacterized membrane protein YbaN (DUF454 family)
LILAHHSDGAAADVLKQTWRELKRSSPGSRFQELYRRQQEGQRGGLNKAIFMGGGLLTIAAGVLLYPVPVIPSEPVILLGLALFAQGSMRGARILDWIELRLRGPFRWASKWWKPLPRAAKIALSVLWMALVSAAGYGVYRLIFGT